MPLRTTVQSFDLFDTLIGRVCVTPANLFAQVGTAFGLTDFVEQRIAAEQRAWAIGGEYGIDTIYRQLVLSDYCDESLAKRIMAAEIDAEFDNAFPIVENVSSVRDYDLVVSDMYLSPSILRGLLQHVGLRRFVHIFVSNAGKYRGTVWQSLIQRWVILRHTGDNEYADVVQAANFGIPARHYLGSKPSGVEQYLESEGLPTLARLLRRLRLINPYVPNSAEADLWNHYVQFNFPFLCFTSREVIKQKEDAGKSKVLFFARDCHFLSEIFSALYPHEPAELLYVSRAAAAADPVAMKNYLLRHDCASALLCDVVSTGHTWGRFAEDNDLRLAMFAMIYMDHHQIPGYDPESLERKGNLRFRFFMRSTELHAWSLVVELVNTAPHGPTEAVDQLEQDFIPQFKRRHEIPRGMLTSLILAQTAAMQGLRESRGEIRKEIAEKKVYYETVSSVFSSLSNTDWLNYFAGTVIF